MTTRPRSRMRNAGGIGRAARSATGSGWRSARSARRPARHFRWLNTGRRRPRCNRRGARQRRPRAVAAPASQPPRRSGRVGVVTRRPRTPRRRSTTNRRPVTPTTQFCCFARNAPKPSRPGFGAIAGTAATTTARDRGGRRAARDAGGRAILVLLGLVALAAACLAYFYYLFHRSL